MRWRENPGTAVLQNIMPPRLSHQRIGDDIVVAGRTLRAIWVGQGYPADVRALASNTPRADSASIPVVTARRMSPGARELLEERGLSWADAAGYGNITDGQLLHIMRLEPQALRTREVGDIVWSRSKDAVAEFLLSRRVKNEGFNNLTGVAVDRLATISESTELSIAQTAKILAEFDDLGYTTKVGSERGPSSSREFRQPGQLLSDWAGHHAKTSGGQLRTELHTPSRDPHDWLSLLRGLNTRWAVSGWLAADELAPLTTSIPDVTVYVDEERYEDALLSFTRDPDVTEVERSGRIRLRSAPPQVFGFVQYHGIPVVSPVRVYADLLRNRGRGEDAAEHLREVAIGF